MPNSREYPDGLSGDLASLPKAHPGGESDPIQAPPDQAKDPPGEAFGQLDRVS